MIESGVVLLIPLKSEDELGVPSDSNWQTVIGILLGSIEPHNSKDKTH